MHYVKISDCQQTQGGVNWNHGTADEAKVSDDTKAEGTDTATNEDPTMSTQFYIYLDNDTEIPPETPPTEEEHPGVKTDDGRVEYDITVATVNHVNMKATVPLYVCMYGFRSTGNVVTPTKDAYQLRNYSTIDKNSRTYIADIVKVTHYSRIYDADHSNDELFSIAYDATSKTYTYWYSDPSTTQGWQQPAIYKTLADEHINASGECYVIYIDGEWDFKAAGTLTGDELVRLSNRLTRTISCLRTSSSRMTAPSATSARLSPLATARPTTPSVKVWPSRFLSCRPSPQPGVLCL